MKKILLILGFIVIFISGSFAQGFDNPQALRWLGLKEDEISRIMEIQQDAERIRKEAVLELNLYKAQLEKLLYSANVDMKEVEKILRESLEWKMQIELATIKSRVEVRRILGEERWTKLLKAMQEKKRKEALTDQQSQSPPPNRNR